MSTSADQESSRLFQTAMSVVASYNDWDIEAMIATRAPNCVHQILPLSMESPPMTNDEYCEHFAKIQPLFQSFRFDVWDVTEDPVRNRVALRARGTGMTEIGEYKGEYMMLMQMTPDQEKVVRIEEFVDSKNSGEFLERVRANFAATQKAEDGKK